MARHQPQINDNRVSVLRFAVGRSFNDDVNLINFQSIGSGRFNPNFINNMLQIREDPAHPGIYFGIDANEFGTHAAGQIYSLNGPPGLPADQMAVTYLTDRSTEVAEVIVDNRVRLVEIQTEKPEDKPLLITGDQLHLVQPPAERHAEQLVEPAAEQQVVSVTGRPAHVEARGLTLESSAIHLDRGRNLLWTDGAGSMTLPLDRPLDGTQPPSARPVPKNTTPPQPLVVTWQGQMQFDGRTANFTRQVESRLPTQYVKTEQLDATFTQEVRFSGPGANSSGLLAGGSNNAGPRTDIDRLTCRQGVYLENRTFEQAQLTSFDRVQAVELTIQQSSGDLQAVGPGTITTIRVDSGDQGDNRATALPLAAQAKPGEAGSTQLTYLNITFQRRAHGNLRRRDLKFENQVRTLYAPVASWDAVLDPLDEKTWGPRGMLLSCDQLAVVEMPAIVAGKTNYELEATGNTTIEGTGYTARAARLTYSQGKDMIVLEGSGRGPARIYRHERVGGAPTEAAARKIRFYPSSNRVDVDDAESLNLSNLPATTPK